MNVIFIEPCFPSNQREFVRGLKSVGANVIAISEKPREWLDPELAGWLSDYVQIGSVVDEGQLERAVRYAQSQVWIDRLEATVEAHVQPAANVRERCRIPGISARTAFLCRDKPAMKDVLRAAGVPTAQSTGASSARDVLEFVDAVGFPVILKPRSAAGAAGTWKATNAEELEAAIHSSGVGHGAPTAVEEFIEGHEGYLDTITVNGEVTAEFITHYYPNVLEAMRTRWISPQMVSTNRIDAPGYEEVRRMARRVIEVLGITTSATHMEWFFGPKGLKFSEIGCRPPGVCQWDVYNAANDIDLYREWALAVTHGRAGQQPSRRFAGGMIALRPDRDGVVSHYDGLDEIGQRYHDNIVAVHLPEPGTPTGDVAAGYMANAWMRVRHPDYDNAAWDHGRYRTHGAGPRTLTARADRVRRWGLRRTCRA
jgi:formate-dependent phosphoribosylglycinamide formyltransferase (GAR transformylase)